jgi:hypothetical protein
MSLDMRGCLIKTQTTQNQNVSKSLKPLSASKTCFGMRNRDVQPERFALSSGIGALIQSSFYNRFQLPGMPKTSSNLPPMQIIMENRVIQESHPYFKNAVRDYVGLKVQEVVTKFLADNRANRGQDVVIGDQGGFISIIGQGVEGILTHGTNGGMAFPPVPRNKVPVFKKMIYDEFKKYLADGKWPYSKIWTPLVTDNNVSFRLKPYFQV